MAVGCVLAERQAHARFADGERKDKRISSTRPLVDGYMVVQEPKGTNCPLTNRNNNVYPQQNNDIVLQREYVTN